MQEITLYLWVVLGVIVSVVLPLIGPLLPKPPKAASLGRKKKPTKWEIMKPYVITGIFSFIVAVVILAFIGEQINSWQTAFLAGYTADSTLQKLTTGNS